MVLDQRVGQVFWLLRDGKTTLICYRRLANYFIQDDFMIFQQLALDFKVSGLLIVAEFNWHFIFFPSNFVSLRCEESRK